jgi:hypothetical protein
MYLFCTLPLSNLNLNRTVKVTLVNMQNYLLLWQHVDVE